MGNVTSTVRAKSEKFVSASASQESWDSKFLEAVKNLDFRNVQICLLDQNRPATFLEQTPLHEMTCRDLKIQMARIDEMAQPAFVKMMNAESIQLAELKGRICPWNNAQGDVAFTAVARVLQAAGFSIDGYDRSGRTPLQRAAIYGQWRAVDDFIYLGAEINKVTRDSDKRTALHYAAYFGYTDVVRIFLSRKRELNLEIQDNNHQTALECARQAGYNQIADLLHGASRTDLLFLSAESQSSEETSSASSRSNV